MKHIALVFALAAACAVPCAVAQTSAGGNGGERYEAGVFADYFDFSRTGPHIKFLGVGARVGVNMGSWAQLEAEMSYDFSRAFANAFSNGFTTSFASTRLRPLHALFGPKFNKNLGPGRAFLTVKGGFLNFTSTTQNPPAGFTSTLATITAGTTRPAVYPGLGFESFWGPIGLRLEGGDEFYFDHGMKHNIKASFGPMIRF